MSEAEPEVVFRVHEGDSLDDNEPEITESIRRRHFPRSRTSLMKTISSRENQIQGSSSPPLECFSGTQQWSPRNEEDRLHDFCR